MAHQRPWVPPARFRLRTRIAPFLVLAAAVAVAVLPAAPAGAAPQFRGATLHSLWNSNVADMERDLDAARRLGANAVRVDVWWASIESQGKETRAKWYLERLDRFVNGAAARGMKVVPSVLMSPCWASAAPESLKGGCTGDWGARGVHLYPPENPVDYGDFLAFVAARYGAKLAGIVVWNEPNHSGFLKSDNPARSYAGLVKAGFSGVKASAPGVRVIAGALSGSDVSFLNSLYAYGIRGRYDALAVHPYSGDQPPDSPVLATRASFVRGLKSVRAAQAVVGDKAPVWITEVGWNTGSLRDVAFWANGISEATQAKYLTRAFQLLSDPAQGLGFVQTALVYNLRNNGTDAAAPNDNYGLLRRDFSAKPAYSALRSAWSATGASTPASAPATSAPPTSAIPVPYERLVPRIASRRATGRRRVSVRVSCRSIDSGRALADRTCRGRLVLRTVRRLRPRRGSKPARIRLGWARLEVKAGKGKRMRIRLSRRGRRAVARLRRLRVKAAIVTGARGREKVLATRTIQLRADRPRG